MLTSNEVSKKKIVHIHSDGKFVFTSSYFPDEVFDNQLVLLGSKGQYGNIHDDGAVYFTDVESNIDAIVKIANGSDLTVMYSLDNPKQAITKAMSSRIKIAWFFFGFELYRRNKSDYLSGKTKAIVFDKPVRPYWLGIKSLVKKLLFVDQRRELEFKRLVKKIGYFICLSTVEYNDLQKKWPFLPEFVQMPFRVQQHKDFLQQGKNKTILAGNSRNYWNNHFEILDTIELANRQTDYEFIWPLNYGQQNRYYANVRSAIAGKNNMVAIDDFLPIKAYEKLFETSAAYVLNSYRPMAMWNIITAMNFGLKVYLNHKNSTLDWLRGEGFHLYNISELPVDIDNHDVALNRERALSNHHLIQKLAEKNSVEAFINTMRSKLS